MVVIAKTMIPHKKNANFTRLWIMYQATIDYRGQDLDGIIIPILSLFFRFSVGFSWPSRRQNTSNVGAAQERMCSVLRHEGNFRTVGWGGGLDDAAINAMNCKSASVLA